MSDNEDEEIVHEVMLPDNTYSVFCTFDPVDNTLRIYDGDFNCSDAIKEIGSSVRVVMESILAEAAERLAEINPDITVEPMQRIKKIDGNVVYANFKEKVH
jgi:hypothetical protein